MTPKLTDEMRAAIELHPGEPVAIQDDRTQKVYVLIDRERAADLLDRWLLQELQIGFDDAGQGNLVGWDPDRIKQTGRQRLAERR